MKINFINKFNTAHAISKTKFSLSFSGKDNPLYMIDNSGNVSKYSSMKEVSVALGVNIETIKKALKENKKAGGVTIKIANKNDERKK